MCVRERKSTPAHLLHWPICFSLVSCTAADIALSPSNGISSSSSSSASRRPECVKWTAAAAASARVRWGPRWHFYGLLKSQRQQSKARAPHRYNKLPAKAGKCKTAQRQAAAADSQSVSQSINRSVNQCLSSIGNHRQLSSAKAEYTAAEQSPKTRVIKASCHK